MTLSSVHIKAKRIVTYPEKNFNLSEIYHTSFGSIINHFGGINNLLRKKAEMHRKRRDYQNEKNPLTRERPRNLYLEFK